MTRKLLVYVLAYNAERFIEDTLRRIPAGLDAFDTHVLVVDDASPDRTFDLACGMRDRGEVPFPMTVLRNPTNQGYGGNVKLGIRYAIREGFDAVALTHGDGQYPPELIPDYAPVVLEGEADAVFGSRMMNRADARKGRMPLYKFLGNIFLTTLQNSLLGTRLTEFHTGFRIYSTAAMRRVPFELASNYFDFDTDVTLQFLAAGLAIAERPIPTRYGEETSHVNVIRYGLLIVRSALAFWAQRHGLYYQRKYDTDPDDHERRYLTPRVELPEAHEWAVERIPAGARVLDVGSGDALVGGRLKAKDCQVTGVDAAPPPEDGRLDRFLPGDLDNPLPVRADEFDVVLLLDVLSFCRRPEAFLERLHATSGGNAQLLLIVSTGNVGFVVSRLQLLFGFLNYARHGLIHGDHVRLFTQATVIALLEDHGFRVTSVRATGAPYARALGDGPAARLLARLNTALIKLWPSLFGYRLLIEARPRPSLDRLLDAAIATSPSGD